MKIYFNESIKYYIIKNTSYLKNDNSNYIKGEEVYNSFELFDMYMISLPIISRF